MRFFSGMIGMGLILGSGMALANPVSVMPAGVIDQKNLADKILFSEGKHVVVRSDSAKLQDFNDLYVVRTPFWMTEPTFLSEQGEVLEFVPAEFAVMKLKGDKVNEVSGMLHQKGLACGTVFKLSGDAISTDKAKTPDPVIPVANTTKAVQDAVNMISADNVQKNVKLLSDITTRYHDSTSGQSVADRLATEYEGSRRSRGDVTIQVYRHSRDDTAQPSLVVRIEGKTRPSELLILGSHIDSINYSGGDEGRSPGADDNASGTAANMEVFRVIMEQGIQFERSIEIHGYAAEEIGLVGSQAIARDYKAAGKNVVAMVQNDMNLYKAKGTPDKITFVNNNTDAAFNDSLGSLIDTYVKIPWGKGNLMGGDSDHSSWRRQGYATSFPFENPQGYNRHIHTANDTIENSGAFTQSAAFAKLSLAYLMHYGGVVQ